MWYVVEIELRHDSPQITRFQREREHSYALEVQSKWVRSNQKGSKRVVIALFIMD